MNDNRLLLWTIFAFVAIILATLLMATFSRSGFEEASEETERAILDHERKGYPGP